MFRGERVKKLNIRAYLFLLPALLLFFAYILYPIIYAGWSSLYDWSTMKDMRFVGMANYREAMTDQTLWLVIKNVFLWIAVTVPVQAGLGFFLAYVIEEKIHRGKKFFRTVFFLPVATSVAVVAIIFAKMFQPYQGIVIHFMQLLGVKAQINILGNTHQAIWGIMLANIWEWTGWSMLLYIAGIAQIPTDIKEAGKIDGATSWKEILYIYIPYLAPIHKALLMLGIIGSLQTFALIYSMTNGGPNHATEMPGTYIFKMGFGQQQMGYAAAISVLTLLLALLLTLFQVRFLGSAGFMEKER